MLRLGRGGRLLFALAILAATLFLVACPQQHSVAELMRDPGRYANKEVAVRGTVVSSYGALGTGLYQVDDGTGRIWVLSENYGVPSKGARVGVAGRIVPTVSFGGRSFATVIRETQRRHGG